MIEWCAHFEPLPKLMTAVAILFYEEDLALSAGREKCDGSENTNVKDGASEAAGGISPA